MRDHIASSFSCCQRRKLAECLAVACLSLAGTCQAWADSVRVAVAANFSVPFGQLARDFEMRTGHQAIMITGSTGKFYTQIKAGAPFDVLLAADQATPNKLAAEGWVAQGQRFTYATGQLVLWSPQMDLVDKHGDVLKQASFTHLAMANPKVAPYGAAALEVLTALKLNQALASKVVLGESITQAMQFVASGNASLGFVAMSQVLGPQQKPTGSWWLVPTHLYRPLVQDAVLLKHGKGKVAALAFMRYLRSNSARAIIKSYGYAL